LLKNLPKKAKAKKEDRKKEVLQSPRGMRDILPSEQPFWEKIRKVSRDVADSYGFLRIDTPILEDAEVFEKGVGKGTDIVEKEMFIVRTKGGDRLALRPEGTAGIMRAYVQNGLSRLSQPLKLYYFGQMFRYERPQAGRYRQFHQAGFEILGGTDDSVYDAQAITATLRLIEDLKIKNLTVRVNSIGCGNCRGAFKKKLQEHYRRHQKEVCKDCQRRITASPMRLLDCKEEKCRPIKEKAPAIMDYLCSPCRSHFRSVLEYLDEAQIGYLPDPYLVRGLDYYNRTVFEIFTEGMESALAGGGRYDYLAEMMGIRKGGLPAIGSSLGIERLVEAMKSQEIAGLNLPKAKFFLVQIGKPAKRKSFKLLEDFRKAGLKVGEAIGKDSLKAQLKVADKEGAEMALILGQKEVFEETIIIRDMKNGVQETVPLERAVEEAKKRIKTNK
jgi:histidyl-tRNA synthetase